MTFKKSLRTKNNRQAQATLEYFVVFAVIVLLTLLSITAFHERFISATQDDFFQKAVGEDGLNVENK